MIQPPRKALDMMQNGAGLEDEHHKDAECCTSAVSGGFASLPKSSRAGGSAEGGVSGETGVSPFSAELLYLCR